MRAFARDGFRKPLYREGYRADPHENDTKTNAKRLKTKGNQMQNKPQPKPTGGGPLSQPNTNKYMQIPANTCKYKRTQAKTSMFKQTHANTNTKYDEIPANTSKYTEIPANTNEYQQIAANACKY